VVELYFTGSVIAALQIIDKDDVDPAVSKMVVDAFEQFAPGLDEVLSDIHFVLGEDFQFDEGILHIETDEDTAMYFRLKHSDFVHDGACYKD